MIMIFFQKFFLLFLFSLRSFCFRGKIFCSKLESGTVVGTHSGTTTRHFYFINLGYIPWCARIICSSLLQLCFFIVLGYLIIWFAPFFSKMDLEFGLGRSADETLEYKEVVKVLYLKLDYAIF